MNNLSLYLSAICLFFSTCLSAQNGPPPEVDKAIRATVDLLINSDATDYKSYINKFYSQKISSNTPIDSLVNELKQIKKSTAVAGGIDVAKEDDVIQIHFSGSANAIVELTFENNESGKITSIQLAQMKDPSTMTAEEKYNHALDNKLRSLESLPTFTTDSEFETFIKENFSASFIAKTSISELVTSLKKLSISVASATMFDAKPSANGNGMTLVLRGGKSADVLIGIEKNAPYQINLFEINNNVSFLNKADEELLPITWENYQGQLKQEEAKGFSGVILIAHNGKIVHHQGYGFANQKTGVKNDDKTIYDVGSIPIDFTLAAILKLVDLGKISYADPITKFIKEVPQDKKLMTIGHLMNNKSGLQNFHGDNVKDQDHDLSWISREEAINRMLSKPLLFEPGTDVSPSHSGYGLLAAIVEIVSGKTYEAFLSENFFVPLKMINTGSYGKESDLSPAKMAVGYGKQASNPNIPTNWGPTSWLIKGSGGMVSNANDLYLWNKGLHSGKLLSLKSKELYGQATMTLGGSERGFFTAYVRSPDNTVIICSNSNRNAYPDVMKLFLSLAALYK